MVGTDAMILDANLSALEAADPELAQRVRRLPLPGSFEPATGRDGSATYRIAGSVGQRVWLGGSSMPRTTAELAASGIHDDGGNLVLPGIATGFEAQALVQRIATHVALFVYEPDLARLKAALSICDSAAWLAARRIVPVSGGDIGGAIADRLRRDPGFEFPRRLVTLVTQRGLDHEALRRSLEAAAPAIVAEQSRLAEEIGRRLRADQTNPRRSIPSAPRVGVISSDARPAALEVAAALARALQQLSWPDALAIPDRPDRCHCVARLAAIEQHRPDLLLFLNGGPGPLAPYLPHGLPAVSWFWHPTSPVAMADAARSAHPLLAATPALLASLNDSVKVCESRHGARPAVLLEVGVDTSVYRPVAPDGSRAVTASDPPDRRRGSATAGSHVLVVADAVDLRPEAGHVQLTSHVNLWNEACRIIAARPDRYHPSRAGAVLDEAQRRSGTILTESELRDAFIGMILERIAPTTIIRAAIERLLAAGWAVRILGQGWSAHPTVAAAVAGPVPAPAACAAAYASAAVVLFPYFSHTTAQRILEVLASGGVPLFRPPEQRLSELHPQLAEAFGPVAAFVGMDDMVSAVKYLTHSGPAALLPLERLRADVVTRHALAQRLEKIRRLVWGDD